MLRRSLAKSILPRLPGPEAPLIHYNYYLTQLSPDPRVGGGKHLYKTIYTECLYILDVLLISRLPGESEGKSPLLPEYKF